MPRPKRTKVTPSAPTAIPNSTKPFNPALRNIASPQPSENTTTNSDDSEGIVRTIRTNIGSQHIRPQDVRMSGALAPEDVKGSTRLRPPSGRQRAALSRIAREADHAAAIEALERRRDEAMAKEKAPRAQDEVLVPSSLPTERLAEATIRAAQEGRENWTRTVERARLVPSSHRKLQATPGAESSILALTNFKRRPRQPSILQIGRQDTTLSESDLDDAFDDFQPDDESTPFHVTRIHANVRATPSQPATNGSSSQNVTTSSSRKRKLTTPEVQVQRSQSPASNILSSPPEQSQKHVLELQQMPEATPTSSEPTLPAVRTKSSSSQTLRSDIMAPPQSSSPSQSPARPPPVLSSHKAQSASKSKSRSKRTQPSRNGNSNRPTTIKTNTPHKQPLRPISTATLQNLLPRRRRRPPEHAAGDFDIPSSGTDENSEVPMLAEDEDELSFVAPKGQRKGVGTKPQKGKLKPSMAAMKKTPAGNRTKTPGKQKPKTPSLVRTYSRRASDKENASGTDDDHQGDRTNDSLMPNVLTDTSDEVEPTGKGTKGVSAKAKTEIKTLAKKFKEVDQWEMEFEVVTASSSSPADAR